MSQIQFRTRPIWCTIAGALLLAALALTPAPMLARNSSSGSISYPTGGETLVAGDSCTIRWDTTGLQSTLTIRLWDGEASVWETLATDVSTADGEYTWLVDDSLTGQRFRIRLDDGRSGVLSATYFNIEKAVELEKRFAVDLRTVDQAGSTAAVSVLPNPASSMAVLQANAPIAHLNITNLSGQTVRTIEGDGVSQLQIPLTGLAAGVYIFETMLVDGQRVVTRFIVQ